VVGATILAFVGRTVRLEPIDVAAGVSDTFVRFRMGTRGGSNNNKNHCGDMVIVEKKNRGPRFISGPLLYRDVAHRRRSPVGDGGDVVTWLVTWRLAMCRCRLFGARDRCHVGDGNHMQSLKRKS
jgi:hypothetical protein